MCTCAYMCLPCVTRMLLCGRMDEDKWNMEANIICLGLWAIDAMKNAKTDAGVLIFELEIVERATAALLDG
jgi:hypothetical protein